MPRHNRVAAVYMGCKSRATAVACQKIARPFYNHSVIGENLRRARLHQQQSLADVAKKAKISVATLSRIENEKQTLELGLFLTLAGILDRSPTELLGNDADGDGGAGIDPLVKKVITFEASVRAQFWRELAAAKRMQRAKSRRIQVQQLAQHVEELLAQIDLMREDLESVRKRLRRSSR